MQMKPTQGFVQCVGLIYNSPVEISTYSAFLQARGSSMVDQPAKLNGREA